MFISRKKPKKHDDRFFRSLSFSRTRQHVDGDGFLYFARAREATGGLVEETVDAEHTDALRAVLVERHPELESVLQSSVLAVNQGTPPRTSRSGTGDEVAVIPPISGG